MDNCIQLIEQLSAYSDGELIESEKLLVEKHIADCEACSALLKVFEEISVSVNESTLTAPKALISEVMDKIQSESSVIEGNNKKQRKRYIVFLTRYAPIAACMTIILLIWQFWGIMWGANDAEMPAAAPMSESTTMESADVALDLDHYMDDAGAYFNDDFPMEAADGSFQAESMPDIVFDNSIMADEDSSFEDVDWVSDYIDAAYAQINIVGELPAFLSKLTPQPFASRHEWDMVFEIPRDEISALLEELGDNDGVLITYNHSENSTYAVVLFSGR